MHFQVFRPWGVDRYDKNEGELLKELSDPENIDSRGIFIEDYFSDDLRVEI